jgi:hypothetical protein
MDSLTLLENYSRRPVKRAHNKAGVSLQDLNGTGHLGIVTTGMNGILRFIGHSSSKLPLLARSTD